MVAVLLVLCLLILVAAFADYRGYRRGWDAHRTMVSNEFPRRPR